MGFFVEKMQLTKTPNPKRSAMVSMGSRCGSQLAAGFPASREEQPLVGREAGLMLAWDGSKADGHWSNAAEYSPDGSECCTCPWKV